MRLGMRLVVAAIVLTAWFGSVWSSTSSSGAAVVVYGASQPQSLDAALTQALHDAGFTGNIEATLVPRLGRPINQGLADLGRVLWFDKIHALHHDNTCGGCHSPTNGFGDTQSIAIGVDNNNKVGPNRTGPRNQRRSPLVVNTAFYPKLMWNGRFSANPGVPNTLGNPFSNAFGFHFPNPEDDTKFLPFDPVIKHLLQAQGFIPPTEMVEVAGFTGTCGQLGPEFCQFDNGKGEIVPLPDGSGFRNDPIRDKGLQLLNASPQYRQLFHNQFPSVGATVGSGGDIDFSMFGRAIAEFEFTLVFANAPIDRFARGETGAMADHEKRGALVFFGSGQCVQCHAVAGASNEMFSDFKNHVAGIPQIAPYFGVGKSNMIYDGPGQNEDFGLEQVTGDANDRYMFRTAPLRNLVLSPAYFHNGSFTRLKDAIRYHADPQQAAPRYDAQSSGVAKDLTKRLGPSAPVLARLDPILAPGLHLSESDLDAVTAFVERSLFDPRAAKDNLCGLAPASVPSHMPVLDFEKCHP